MPDPTEPPTMPDQEASLARQTLELLVYAPVGLAVTAMEDLPTMAARGRSVLTQTFRNAHLVGQFTVSMGRRELENRLGRRPAPGPPADRPGDGEPAGGTGRPTTTPGAAGEPPALRPVGGGTAPGAVDLAIPGYDSLSASQVVRRLDGLGRRELDAVYRHESTGRRRRTILHRAQQLLGLEPTPGAPEQSS
ncbi:MAG: hypothetical protein ACYCU7_10740 [Acidimicrobiales bacterium]